MKRKELEKWFIDHIDSLEPGNANVAMYKEIFAGLNDVEFGNLMERVGKGQTLPYYAPNFKGTPNIIKNALVLCDKLGVKIWQRMWITDHVTKVKYLSNHEFRCSHLPVRRNSQHASKKKSVALDTLHVDTLTGQASGPSRTVQISYPEIAVFDSLKLYKNVNEMINYRGGNQLAYREYRRSLLNTGRVTQKHLDTINSLPTSTGTIKALLLGMHIDNNIADKIGQ